VKTGEIREKVSFVFDGQVSLRLHTTHPYSPASLKAPFSNPNPRATISAIVSTALWKEKTMKNQRRVARSALTSFPLQFHHPKEKEILTLSSFP